MNPERPTSGDLKSGDSLFFTTPASPNVNRPLVFSFFFPTEKWGMDQLL